jgi:chorismate mutase
LKRILTLRKRIDEIDDEILGSLKQRVEVSKSIRTIKREIGVPIKDCKRENEVYSHTMRKASEIGLNPKEIKAIYKKIIAMNVRAQNSAEKETRTHLS